jgi:hypothetical protein
VDSIFGGTTPEEITQDHTGANDVNEVKAFQLNYYIVGNLGYNEEIQDYDIEVEDFVDEFNKRA